MNQDDLVYRLRKRAEIRRSITTRKSVQENQPDRIADLLEEAADRIARYQQVLPEEDIPFVGILQEAHTVPLGCEIWKSDEEFIKYKKVILTTVRAIEKRNAPK